MSKYKIVFTLFFLAIGLLAGAQEICDNGIDDDGDNLIDLNDTDCDCGSVMPLSSITGSICRDNLILSMNDPNAISYQWYKDGVAISGETLFSIQLIEGPTVEGIYEVMVTTSSGCYTSEPYDLVIPSYYVDLGTETICDGDCVQFGPFEICIQGFFQNNQKASDGCDSVTVLNVLVIPRATYDVYKTICPGQDLVYNGKNYDMPGDYECFLPNEFGCDTLINLHVNESDVIIDTLFETICLGDTIEVYDIVAFETGNYTTLIEEAGQCDIQYTLALTVNEPSDSSVDMNICSGDTLVYLDIVAFDSGTYEGTTTNYQGCDSIVYVNLTVEPPLTGTINTAICEGQTYIYDEGIPIINTDIPGTYYSTLATASGCDSIVTIELGLLPPSETDIERMICDGDSYIFGGEVLNTTGIYRDTLSAVNGCDSIIILDLEVVNEILYSFSEIICEGEVYDFNGDMLSTTGIYNSIIPSVGGCDSIITLDLLVGVPTSSMLDASICDGEEYELHDLTTGVAGDYEVVIENQLGCDSTIFVSLEVLDLSYFHFSDTICRGDMFSFHDIETNQEGMYETKLVSSNGCDSIVTVELVVLELPTGNISATICAGETFVYGDIEATEDGVYEARVPNTVGFGCDSLVTIALEVNEPSDGIYLGEDYEIDLGETTDIVPEYLDPNLTNLQWTDKDGTDLGTGESVLDYEPILDTWVVLSGIDGNGCNAFDTIMIRVDLSIDIFIPNVFSPNGDNVNDQFDIFSNASVVGIESIEIYDRWGELMYSATHDGSLDNYVGWNGTFKNVLLKPGVFAYNVVFNILDDSQLRKSGSVTLVR